MNDPSPWDKFLYIAGKRATPEHLAWLNNFLRDTEPRKLGALLAVPNSLILAVAGLLGLAIGDTGFAALMLVAAAANPVLGAFPAFSRRRATRIARKNNLPAADNG
jgi:hypothetical protein